jgi:glycerate kinase
MKIILAPDSFKGSLSAPQAAAAMAAGIRRVLPEAEIVEIPVADGGEGTLDILAGQMHGQRHACLVQDPLGNEISADWLSFGPDQALVEMAQASGLTLVPAEQRNPWHASTYGTGQLMRDALDHHCRTLWLAIGGSATIDGGIGMARALGLRVLDASGKDVPAGARGLPAAVSLERTSSWPGNAAIRILSDVKNPLLGENGAVYVYGRQKGAAAKDLPVLEKGMRSYAALMEKTCGRDIAALAGSGAAGGLAVPLLAFTDARLESGIDRILEWSGFCQAVQDADLVVCGEGRADFQSLAGKAVSGIARIARQEGVPCWCIAGSLGEGWQQLHTLGIEHIAGLQEEHMSTEQAMALAAGLLEQKSTELMREFLGRKTHGIPQI